MNRLTKSNYFVLTGAMGSGKSALILELRKAGIKCVPEPAREILAEQRSIGSDGVPEENPELFCKLMLSRSLHNYMEGMQSPEIQVFDRGIPDMAAYAELFSIDARSFFNAANQYRYHSEVFFFDGWEEIYTKDSERKIGFEDARRFGDRVRTIYEELGYQIVKVPFQIIEERASFILNKLFV